MNYILDGISPPKSIYGTSEEVIHGLWQKMLCNNLRSQKCFTNCSYQLSIRAQEIKDVKPLTA